MKYLIIKFNSNVLCRFNTDYIVGQISMWIKQKNETLNSLQEHKKTSVTYSSETSQLDLKLQLWSQAHTDCTVCSDVIWFSILPKHK